METPVWLFEVIKWLGMFGMIIALIMVSKKTNNPKVQKREDYGDLPTKDLEELPTGETIIIISFNDDGKPIAEFTDGFALQLPKEQRKFFVLQNAERFSLEKRKTYEVERIGRAQIVNLRQVAMLFT
jgi:hypothetical protein